MPAKPVRRQKNLAAKLLTIREKLGLSQEGMLKKLGLQDDINRSKISEFERGQRIPALYILLAYAEAANVWLDFIVNDHLELPDEIPAKGKVR